MDYFIDVLKVVILLLVGVLTVSMLIEVWNGCEEDDKKYKRKREVLTLEETREMLWINYLYHFH